MQLNRAQVVCCDLNQLHSRERRISKQIKQTIVISEKPVMKKSKSKSMQLTFILFHKTSFFLSKGY